MMNKKIATEVAVGIIVILAIVVGGYFWLQNQLKIGPGSIPKVESFDECVRKGFPVMESYPRKCRTSLGKEFVEEVKTEEKADLEADELADLSRDEVLRDWQTYRNEKYGFEFKYPKDWIIVTNPQSQNSILIRGQKKPEDMLNVFNEAPGFDVGIWYYENIYQEPINIANKLDAKTLEEFVNRDISLSNIRKQLFLNEYVWEVTKGGMSSSFVILSNHGGHIYEIEFAHKEKKDQLSSVDNQILSTFKFIN